VKAEKGKRSTDFTDYTDETKEDKVSWGRRRLTLIKSLFKKKIICDNLRKSAYKKYQLPVMRWTPIEKPFLC